MFCLIFVKSTGKFQCFCLAANKCTSTCLVCNDTKLRRCGSAIQLVINYPGMTSGKYDVIFPRECRMGQHEDSKNAVILNKLSQENILHLGHCHPVIIISKSHILSTRCRILREIVSGCCHPVRWNMSGSEQVGWHLQSSIQNNPVRNVVTAGWGAWVLVEMMKIYWLLCIRTKYVVLCAPFSNLIVCGNHTRKSLDCSTNAF